MHRLVLLLSAASLLLAQEGGPAGPANTPPQPGSTPTTQGAGGLGSYGIFIFLGLMVLMMWFMVIRPQKKEEKRRKEMVDSTKRGDEVITIGGVHGVIEAVGEATIDLRIGKGDHATVVTFNKGAVATNLTNERNAAAKK